MTVDVMFPYYGDVVMMKAAVDSVLSQEDRDFRFTIVDDGYPDDSLPEYFKSLVDNDSRVRYYRNETNLGANGNYKKCLSLVEHDVVVVMGADDIMLPNFIGVVRKAMENPRVKIVQPGVEVIDENGTVYLPLGDRVKAQLRKMVVGSATEAIVAGEPIAQSLITGDWLYFPSVAWRADAILKHDFREQYNVVQDIALAMDIISTAVKWQSSTKCVFSIAATASRTLRSRHWMAGGSLKSVHSSTNVQGISPGLVGERLRAQHGCI